MSLPNYVPYGARQAVSKRWHEAKSKLRMERGPDADTMRKRALYDAKGQLVREGCTYRDGKVVTWRIVRSVAGRCDQFDIIASGQLRETAGKRLIRAKYGARL